MATNKRTYPNNYFVWYNDDDRIAILTEDNTATTGERTKEKYDTFQGSGILSGTITNMTIDGTTVTVTCSEAHGLTHTTSDRIAISGTRHYDGNYTLASTPSTTTFTITSSAIASNADSINALAVSSGTGTATTAANHGYSVGDKVYIDADNNTYDEEVTIATTNGSNQFTYTTSKADDGAVGAATVGDTGTFTSLFIDNGLRITYHSKYEEATATTNNLQSDLGLDSALHNAVVCYIKARLYEDDEDIEYANYYRQMYERKVKKFRGRRSGVRYLAVTRL